MTLGTGLDNGIYTKVSFGLSFSNGNVKWTDKNGGHGEIKAAPINGYGGIGIGVQKDKFSVGISAVTTPRLKRSYSSPTKKYRDKIAVSVDAKNEKVAVKGWTETVELNSVEFCKKLSDIGVKTIIYTDISKDGMLNGTNLEIYKKLSKIVKSDIIASGGITFLDEIKELNENGVYGAIVGKAIYSGNLDLKEVLEVSK